VLVMFAASRSQERRARCLVVGGVDRVWAAAGQLHPAARDRGDSGVDRYYKKLISHFPNLPAPTPPTPHHKIHLTQ
jgi:hypothetical protein